MKHSYYWQSQDANTLFLYLVLSVYCQICIKNIAKVTMFDLLSLSLVISDSSISKNNIMIFFHHAKYAILLSSIVLNPKLCNNKI